MGAKQDGIWYETGVVEKFEDGKANILWRKPIGGGYAGPSIVSGQIFIMDRTDEGEGSAVENNIQKAGEIAGGERIRCLDLTTGETVWEHRYACPYKIAYPNGPRCTPTVDGEFVFALGAMGNLFCFNRIDGELVWEIDLKKDFQAKPPLWGYASHPMVDGNRLLVPV
ncbi:MAG: PQQ-binding-like beta-propeller repeat protein, partial [Planctomycetota bacterium]